MDKAQRVSDWEIANQSPMSDERKTLDQRAPMTDIERLRHSAAHGPRRGHPLSSRAAQTAKDLTMQCLTNEKP
jgi:hypothetical protein